MHEELANNKSSIFCSQFAGVCTYLQIRSCIRHRPTKVPLYPADVTHCQKIILSVTPDTYYHNGYYEHTKEVTLLSLCPGADERGWVQELFEAFGCTQIKLTVKQMHTVTKLHELRF